LPQEPRPPHLFILDDDHQVVPVRDVIAWAEWFESHWPHNIAESIVGDVRISTVFLGVDASLFDGVPLVFETMLFGGSRDGYAWRYPTWKDALAGHNVALAEVMTPTAESRGYA
jgi:hypothetical protein